MIWRGTQLGVILILSCFMGYLTYKRTKCRTAGLLCAWVLASAALVAFNVNNLLTILEMRLKLASGRSFIIVSMLVMFMLHLPRHRLPLMLFFFELLGIANCGFLYFYGRGLHDRAISMDLALIACIWPLAFARGDNFPWWVKWPMLIIPPLTLAYFHQGSTWIFVLLTQLIIYLITTNRFWLLFPSAAALVGGGFYLQGKDLFHDTHRLTEWKLIMEWWSANITWPIGAGTGTYQVLGPEIQNRQENLFVWLHNDLLQIIFEQGLIGFALTLMLIIICVKRARNQPWLLCTIGGFLFAALVQFPLRFIPGALFALLLVRISLEDQ